MSISRLYSFLSDYNNNVAISDVKVDAELDAIIAEVNTKIATGAVYYPDRENLVVAYASASTVDVDADALLVEGYRLTTINLTADITASGANGLDTLSESSGAATWYSIWVIYNPTTTVTASLLSTSAASPTLPSGYTSKRRVGWILNSAADDFASFFNHGDWFHWGTPPNQDFDDGDTDWNTLDISGHIPPGNRIFECSAAMKTSTTAAYFQWRRNSSDADTQYKRVQIGTSTTALNYNSFNAYSATPHTGWQYKVSHADGDGTIIFNGWLDPR